MNKLEFSDIVRELRRRGYIAEGTPKEINITAKAEKVIVDVRYNCNISFSKSAKFYREENDGS